MVGCGCAQCERGEKCPGGVCPTDGSAALKMDSAASYAAGLIADRTIEMRDDDPAADLWDLSGAEVIPFPAAKPANGNGTKPQGQLTDIAPFSSPAVSAFMRFLGFGCDEWPLGESRAYKRAWLSQRVATSGDVILFVSGHDPSGGGSGSDGLDLTVDAIDRYCSALAKGQFAPDEMISVQIKGSAAGSFYSGGDYYPKPTGDLDPIPVRQPGEDMTAYQLRLQAWRTQAARQASTDADRRRLEWFDTVANVIREGAQGALGIVQGALQADAAARAAEAAAAADALARAADDATRAALAAEQAEGAYQKGRLALVQISGGDRASATRTLSEGQGLLASATAARAYFAQLPAHRVPQLLSDALPRAAAKLEEAAQAIERSAVPPPVGTTDNPPAPPERSAMAEATKPLIGAAAGAAVGFAVGGPPGALLGAAVGGVAGYLWGHQG